MKIKMLQTVRGSPNGIDINEYKNGEIYNLPKELADIFIHEGWAKLIEEVEEKIIEIPETQVIKREKKVIKHREKK
jgi:signal peptidase I